MNPVIVGAIALVILIIIIVIVMIVRNKQAANAAAAQEAANAQWRCVPGIYFPIRYVNGDVQCLSTDGINCMGQGSDAGCAALQIPANANPLTCGADHLSKWGSTGYDNPAHWCNKGKTGILGTSA